MPDHEKFGGKSVVVFVDKLVDIRELLRARCPKNRCARRHLSQAERLLELAYAAVLRGNGNAWEWFIWVAQQHANRALEVINACPETVSERP